MKAEIWSWSRARGLFAGVALDGAVLAIDDRANEAAYGRDTTPRMIFEGRATAPSAAVVEFRDTLEEATAAARAARSDTPRPAPLPAAASTTVTTATTVPVGTTTSVDDTGNAPQPEPFQPVQDNPATIEPLPPAP